MSHSTMSKVSPLRQLADIISQSVDKVDTEMAQHNLEYPSLDESFNPFSAAEGASMSPAVRQAATLIVAACAQLSATVHVPALTLYDICGGFHVSSALRVALEGNVSEILRNKLDGLHAKDIAAQNGADHSRLSRVLRILATHHVFKEVQPNVFANNRLSSMMDTLKTVEEIKADPVNKHTNTPGVSAVLEHTTDEIMKCSAYLTEVIYDPVKKSSEALEHTPLARAFNTNKFYFEWIEEPGNEHILKRFAAAMEGSSKLDPPDAILSGFNWGDLGPKSLVVDVGGGLGHISHRIAQQHGDLHFIVQDRPQVLAEAKNFWEKNMPSALEDGNVTLQAHDFFTPQPKACVAVFLCRMILHDYPRNKATVILKHLRAASGPQTKLLLVEQVIPYTCRGYSAKPELSQKLHIKPPEPLLANTGKAKAISYIGDLQMFVGAFGEERTLGTFEELLESAGWRIEDVFFIPCSLHSQILAIPI